MANETLARQLDKYKIIGLEPKAASLLIAYLEEGHILARAARAVKLTEAQAQRIFAKPEFQEALHRHLRRAQTKMEISVERVIEELALIGFARMGRLTRVNEEGQLVPDFTNATEDDLAAVQSVQYTEEETKFGMKRVAKFALCDKRAALVDLRKHLGGQFDAAKAPAGDGEGANAPSEAARLRAMLREMNDLSCPPEEADE